MNLIEFLQMDGYGAYVWSCYGLTLVSLVALAWTSHRQLHSEVARARRRLSVRSEVR